MIVLVKNIHHLTKVTFPDHKIDLPETMCCQQQEGLQVWVIGGRVEYSENNFLCRHQWRQSQQCLHGRSEIKWNHDIKVLQKHQQLYMKRTSINFDKDSSASPIINSTLSSTSAWAQNFLEPHVSIKASLTYSPCNGSIGFALLQSKNFAMFSNCQGRGEGRRSSEYSNVQDSSGTTNLETRRILRRGLSDCWYLD